jgi:DNA-binding CsgD family transcriptional regulator
MTSGIEDMGDCRLIKRYSDLSLRVLGPLSRICRDAYPLLVAHFKLNGDISALFPYIHAVADGAQLFERPVYIKFSLDGVLCGLHPSEGSAGLFETYLQAHDKDSIRPDHRRHRRMSILDILSVLPGRNCGECGHPSCMAFAAALSRQDADPAQCAGLGSPLWQNVAYPVYDAQGSLKKTIAIDVDATRVSRTLEEKQAHIARLEQDLKRLTRIDTTMESTGNNSLPVPLTGRELQVLRLMARGATNTEISELLEISHHTVKSHVIHIFNKLGVDDRTEAAVWAARHSLV